MTGTHICICKYPLFIIDNRDGKEIEYIAMPIDVVKDGNMPVPSIDYEEAVGFDGIVRQYIKVQWQDIKKGDIIKKYDVVGHIVSAGCGMDEATVGECDEKSIYTVLHPADEWVTNHVIYLRNETETKYRNELEGGIKW